jgi:glycosyltransferase involved in cell wall biosynthesis
MGSNRSDSGREFRGQVLDSVWGQTLLARVRTVKSSTHHPAREATRLPKLVVTIPAFDEAEVIGDVIREVPRDIEGVGSVEVIVLDDGSTDGTAEAALAAGADRVVSHKTNKGLAASFRDLLQEALNRGADIIVNTDADNHYDQSRIPDLMRPILEGRADITIGSRDVSALPMRWMNKYGNLAGSFLVRTLARLPAGIDVSTGFRAYSRDAALRLNVISNHTYTHETLIAAVESGLTVVDVPLPARPVTRPSRLIKGIGSHIIRSLSVITLSYAIYQPLRVFMVLALILIAAGLVPMVRFLVLFALSDSGGHVQSLIAGSVLLLVGFQVLILSLLASAISWNRRMLEELLFRERRRDYGEDRPEP